MKILVLGGNGFIGSHIVDKLSHNGHHVRVYDRAPERYRSPLPKVEYVAGNFDDQLLLAESMEGVDIICHFISTTVPGTSNIDMKLDIETNLINTLNLLNIMHKKSMKKIVYLSSGGAIYGNPQIIPIPENHPLNPISSYGVVKLAIEKYLFMYQELYDFEPIILRPSNPFGPRQGHQGTQGLIGTLLGRVIRGEPIEVWGNGKVIRDYIYIDDFVELCIAAIEGQIKGVYNAGSGKGHSILDVISAVNEITGYDNEIIFKQGRVFDPGEIVLDITLAKRTFGWQQKTSLCEGILKHYHWIRTDKHLVEK